MTEPAGKQAGLQEKLRNLAKQCAPLPPGPAMLTRFGPKAESPGYGSKRRTPGNTSRQYVTG